MTTAANNATPVAEKKLITEIFVDGARKGWNAAITSMMPNVVMAFVIIRILEMSHGLDVISKGFEPVMSLFGLPGSAGIMLIGYWLSMGGGLGVALALLSKGQLNAHDLVVMAPACYIVGSNIQYLGRILSVIGTEGRYHSVMQVINFITGFVSIAIMQAIV
jgi:spore maturation protein SpmB